jgi:hypothetical protein
VTPIVASAIHRPILAISWACVTRYGHACAVDQQADGSGRCDETTFGEIKPKQCSGPEAALVSNQTAEQARYGACDPRDVPAKAHSPGESGQLAYCGEQEQGAKHDIEPPITGPPVEKRARQAASRARQAEVPEDSPVNTA